MAGARMLVRSVHSSVSSCCWQTFSSRIPMTLLLMTLVLTVFSLVFHVWFSVGILTGNRKI